MPVLEKVNQVHSPKQINSHYVNIRNNTLLTERDIRNRHGHSNHKFSTI